MSNASSSEESPLSGSTIYAVSSGTGVAGVAVIRVSGPQAVIAVQRIAAPAPAPREVAFRTLRHPLTGDVLDRAVVFWFAGPRSETGEDVAEFQVHGGRAVVRAVLDAIGSLPGTRLADAGEFARRAFDNGKLDLIEVEGLGDLVEAETEAQRRLALSQAIGAQSKIYDAWRTRLIACAALIEAAIDFSDEADVAADAVARARTDATDLVADISAYLADNRRGEILRDGFRVVLAGPPNVGKSSLLNALARRDVAIVSDQAGTTRDVIEVHLDLGGYRVIVSDTAGIRQTDQPIEREGIRRTIAAAHRSDLILWLTAATDLAAMHNDVSGLPADAIESTTAVAHVVTKSDLIATDQKPARATVDHYISSMTGAGVSELTDWICSQAQLRIGADDRPPLTQVRHRQLLTETADGVQAFLAGDPTATELRAEDLRRATFALGRLTGRVDVEDVLDQVFERFCIGK